MGYILESLNKREEKEQNCEISLWKRLIFIIFIFFFFLLVAFKLFDFQILKYRDYLAKAENNFLNKKPIYPPRGIIYSSDNIALVQNAPIFKVVIDLNTLDRFKVYKEIKDVLPQNLLTFLQENKIALEAKKIDDINKDLKFGKDYFVLKSFYDEKEYTALKTKLKNLTFSKLFYKLAFIYELAVMRDDFEKF